MQSNTSLPTQSTASPPLSLVSRAGDITKSSLTGHQRPVYQITENPDLWQSCTFFPINSCLQFSKLLVTLNPNSHLPRSTLPPPTRPHSLRDTYWGREWLGKGRAKINPGVSPGAVSGPWSMTQQKQESKQGGGAKGMQLGTLFWPWQGQARFHF